MKIRILRGTTIHAQSVNEGEIHDIPESTAMTLIQSKLAEEAKETGTVTVDSASLPKSDKKGKTK